MDELLKKIAQDVEKIREEQVELIKQGAVHNHLLKEHEARSIALQKQIEITETKAEERFKPIEKHVAAVNTILKVIGVAASSITVVYYSVTLFSKLFG